MGRPRCVDVPVPPAPVMLATPGNLKKAPAMVVSGSCWPASAPGGGGSKVVSKEAGDREKAMAGSHEDKVG